MWLTSISLQSEFCAIHSNHHQQQSTLICEVHTHLFLFIYLFIAVQGREDSQTPAGKQYRSSVWRPVLTVLNVTPGFRLVSSSSSSSVEKWPRPSFQLICRAPKNVRGSSKKPASSCLYTLNRFLKVGGRTSRDVGEGGGGACLEVEAAPLTALKALKKKEKNTQHRREGRC